MRSAENRGARERDRQALRLRRYGMAAATSLMVIALLWIAYGFGDLTWRGATHGTALILFWVALFYVLLRSGLNLRLADPSLTLPQVSVSMVTVAYIMYFQDRGRGALVVIFLVSFLFAVFRLRTRQLLFLAALGAASYGVTHLAGTSAATLASRVQQTLGQAAPVLVALTALGRRDEETAALFSATVPKPIKALRLFDALADLLVRPWPRGDAAPAAPAGPTLADRHPLRILVAEDNGVNQRVVLAMLRRLGYRADLAVNGREAVEAVRQCPYDVVLMDLQMPELDGLDALRQIHAEHATSRRPRVIALTANAFEEDRQECLAAGMDDYLSKPLQRDHLQAALERAGRTE